MGTASKSCKHTCVEEGMDNACKSCKHTCVEEVKGALLVNRVNIHV